MKKKLVLSFFIISLFTSLSSQSFSAMTEYGWDQWKTVQWAYIYSGGWCYAVPGKLVTEQRAKIWPMPVSYNVTIPKPTGNARDFYFRFKYGDFNLHELTKKEWKKMRSKKDEGWYETTCQFEYYISDAYQTLQSALKAHSWPCAKYYIAPNKPLVLKTTTAKAKVHFTDDDEVRTINFWIDGLGFAISVEWDFSGYTMTPAY